VNIVTLERRIAFTGARVALITTLWSIDRNRFESEVINTHVFIWLLSAYALASRDGRGRVRRNAPIRRGSKFSATHVRHAGSPTRSVFTASVAMVEPAFRALLVPRIRLPM